MRDAINLQLKLIEKVLDGTLHELNEFLRVSGIVGNEITGVFSDFVGIGAHIFGKDNPLQKIAPIQMPQINENLHFEIPESFVTNIQQFNPPTLQDIEHKFDDFVAIPFNDLRKLIETSFDQMNVTQALGDKFMTSTYEPEKYTFCRADNLNLKWVDTFTNGITGSIRIICYIVIGLIVVLTFYHAASIFFWDKVRSTELNYLQSLFEDSKVDSKWVIAQNEPTSIQKYDSKIFFQDAFSFINHPLYHRSVLMISKIFSGKKWRYRFRWFIDYTFHIPSLLCLAIGLVGIFSILIQIYLINKAEQRELPSLLIKASLALKKISLDLSIHINNITLPYATFMLSDITKIETTVNDELSNWVDKVVSRLDTVVTLVVKTYTDLIRNTFGFFPYLAETVLKFVACMLGIKMEDVDAVGNFVKDSFKVTIPTPDPEMFRVSEDDIKEHVMPFFDSAYNGNGGGGMLGSLITAVKDYKEYLWKQLKVFILFAIFGGSIFVWSLVTVIYWILGDIAMFFSGKKEKKQRCKLLLVE